MFKLLVRLARRPQTRAPQTRTPRRQPKARRGAISVFAAILIVVMLASAAFAIDIGMICMAKAELQCTAYSSALAATDELLHQLAAQPGQAAQVIRSQSAVVQSAAVSTAFVNAVFRQPPDVALNPANDQAGEIVIGEMFRNADGAASLITGNPAQYNSVAVTIRRTAEHNGQLPLFFGRVLGMNAVSADAQAQAAFLQNFKGFRIPGGGAGDPAPTLPFLPFAVDQSVWQKAQNGAGSDNYGWNRDSQSVEHRGDGIPDVDLFPLDTGASGNFGTVDIGSNNSNNSTLERQIVSGLTQQDLDFHGGQLALDASGKLILSGDPGMKVGAVQPYLQQLIGQTRIIPLYNSVTGNGQEAEFTIVAFAACRILDVQLTGSDKHLTIQPAPIITRGGIPGDPGTTTQIYSPVVLVR